VLRRLGSIFTSVYAAVQKVKKDSCKELQFSLVDKSKLNVSLSSKEITPQLSFNHLAIPQSSWSKNPKIQWTLEDRKIANLDQRLKSLIMFVLPDDQMNSVINCLTAKSTWDDLILYHEGPFDVKESRVMDMKLCYNTFKFKKGKSLTQTFTRYKALMNELVNDDINLSKLEINTGFINGLPKKWLSFCQSLRNINHVKDCELASLFGKLKYEENLINNIYETKKSKSLVSTTPLLTAFFASSIVQDFQDNPDDQEDIKSNHEYLKDLEEEYQARALLAKSKRFFKKGTQRFSSTKATDQTECNKCGKKGHFARDYWSKTSVPSYQSPFQPKLLHSSEHKSKPRETKDFEAKYNKVKAKLALIDSSTSAPRSSDENEVTEVKALTALNNEERISVSKESSSDDEWVKISIQMVHTLLEMEEAWLNSSNKVNQCISEQIPTQKKKILGIDQLTEDTSSSGPKDPVFVKSSADNSEVSITGSNKPKLSEAEDSTLSNHDNGKHPLLPLEKLTGVEHVFEPKTIKSILKSKFTFKAETLKGFTINEPSSAPARGNNEICGSYDHDTHGHNRFIALRRGIKPRNPQHITKNYETCGSNVHTTFDHNDIEWFRKREALQAKKVESFKASKTKSSSALRSKTPTKRHFNQHEKHVNDMLRMYDKIDSSENTPIMTPNMLGPDLNGKAVNES
ncbi:hypothetical protein Tco_1024241, partial [Tanacetum coccineum]